MKLTIRNFRCYVGERVFSFERDLIFLTGASGMSKTSTLDALIFSLYGKVKNCTSNLTTEPYSVDLEITEGTIKRTKGNVIFHEAKSNQTFCDVVAQEKINRIFGRRLFVYSQTYGSLFWELQPRDQLETLEDLLFGGEVDIKDLKARFNAEKRALDSVAKTLDASKSQTLGFIRSLGSVEEVKAEPADERALKHRLAFLQNRLALQRLYVQRRDQLARDLADLREKIATTRSAPIIPFSKEQLMYHNDATQKLERLGWQSYLDNTVEECAQAIEDYKRDRQILMGAHTFECPQCFAGLRIEGRKLVTSQVEPEEVARVLEELEAPTTDVALEEIKRQIGLFEDYKIKREKIDELKPHLLPVANGAELYRAVLAQDKLDGRAEELDSQFSQRNEQLARVEKVAKESGVATWDAHRREVDEITTMLQNIDLYEMRAKETKIREEYSAQLDELQKKVVLCEARRAGLARASTILAATEQQYLSETIDHIVSELNRLLREVFIRPPQVEMQVEATAGGARKLRITFDRAYTYEMFSGGEKARINLCFLLVLANFQNYRLLLLDEFTRFLDKDTARDVLQMVRRNFRGQIIAAEHEMPEGVDDAQEIKCSL